MSHDPDPTLHEDPTPAPAPPVDRGLRVVVVAAVAIGVALRFWPRSGLWLDEALTVNISTLPLGDIGEALRRDGHPPLFYWLLNVWTSIGGTSDWWVRALAGVISLAALPLSYLAGRRLASRAGSGPLGVQRTGLIALALMAVIPYGIRYGSETRMYSLATTLTLVGYLVVDDLVVGRSTGPRRWWTAAAGALTTAALLWTHYWSMWFLAVIGAWVLVLAWRSTDPQRRTGRWMLAGAMVVGGALYLPWVPSLLYQSSRTGTPWGEQFGIIRVITTTIADFSGDTLTSYVLVSFLVLSVAATILVVARAPRVVLSGTPERRTLTEILLLVATLVLGWAISTATGNTYSARYAAVVYPLFVLSVAAGVALLRGTRSTLAALVVIIALSTYVAGTNALGDRTQADQIADRIVADLDEVRSAAGGDVPATVVVCPDQIGVALQRALEHRDVELDVRPYPADGDPRFIDWVDYAERNEAADPAGFWAGVTAGIDPGSRIYAAVMPGYQTFDGQCEQLLSIMITERSLVDTVEAGEDREAMGLWILEPTS